MFRVEIFTYLRLLLLAVLPLPLLLLLREVLRVQEPLREGDEAGEVPVPGVRGGLQHTADTRSRDRPDPHLDPASEGPDGGHPPHPQPRAQRLVHAVRRVAVHRGHQHRRLA